MLTLESYKSLGTPHYFGLGFIQLKVNETERFHFYHPELMPILDEDEIHDHRYDFESMIIKGKLYNEIWDYNSIPFQDHGLFEVSCKKEDAGKEPRLVREVEPYEVVSFSCSQGDSYKLKDFMFHRIKYPVPTITLLRRGPITKDYARVIKPVDSPAVCPFSKKMELDEIWDIVDKILSA